MKTALRQLSASHRTEQADTRLGVVLAFVAGAVNAGGFLAVGAYTSHMTGMVASITDLVVVDQWRTAVAIIPHILAFFAGSVLSAVLINWARLKHLASEFALPLMAEACLLIVFGLLAATGLAAGLNGLYGLIALLCLIMGLQNGLITKISHAEIRTTHMTGVITDLGIETGRFLFGKVSHADTRFSAVKLRRLVLLLVGFVIGGLAGAAAFSWIGFVAVLPLAALLAAMALLPIADDLKRMFSKHR
ncbi:hypothetical protein ABI_13900 [Asticcacaulis biprosthecium C19]|uniref:DUF1275 domain-containing protein n=1 Tax=Asticcacaulis biprosthecium C19 TaxID=715226 RepID=F4QIG2_9CAUL|nr:YoaK family protein [Asticcacaulis biprosthecium]EGF92951.1 hypothetical protein ABI_13900 [Asticcacaulis biprosthecium C19]